MDETKFPTTSEVKSVDAFLFVDSPTGLIEAWVRTMNLLFKTKTFLWHMRGMITVSRKQKTIQSKAKALKWVMGLMVTLVYGDKRKECAPQLHYSPLQHAKFVKKAYNRGSNGIRRTSWMETNNWSRAQVAAIDADIVCSWRSSKYWSAFRKASFGMERGAAGKLVHYKAGHEISRKLDRNDSDETFAHVGYFSNVRLILAIAVQKEWHVQETDYSLSFLQEILRWAVYMMPQRFMNGVKFHHLVMLKKTFYGLKVSPHIWFELPEKKMKEIGLSPVLSAGCVFRRHGVLVLCCIEDLLIIRKNRGPWQLQRKALHNCLRWMMWTKQLIIWVQKLFELDVV